MPFYLSIFSHLHSIEIKGIPLILITQKWPMCSPKSFLFWCTTLPHSHFSDMTVEAQVRKDWCLSDSIIAKRLLKVGKCTYSQAVSSHLDSVLHMVLKQVNSIPGSTPWDAPFDFHQCCLAYYLGLSNIKGCLPPIPW